MSPANLTVETWLQINANWATNDKILKKKVDWNSTSGWMFELKNELPTADCNMMGSGTTHTLPTVGWVQGQWHHLVFTINGTTMTPWLDGVKLTGQAAPIDAVVANSGVPLEIAYDEGGYVPVALDDLRISSTVRTDCWIQTEYNNQARAAYDYLVSLGVPADRLKTVSYGKEVPACSESTEACWQRNRRAHFTVTGKTK